MEYSILAGRSRVTREAILETATRIISETGAASMTFQTLGETLGVTKQAIIYWFPSKSDLTRELIMPALELEADAVVAALRRIKSGRRAIEVFLRTLIAFSDCRESPAGAGFLRRAAALLHRPAWASPAC